MLRHRLNDFSALTVLVRAWLTVLPQTPTVTQATHRPSVKLKIPYISLHKNSLHFLAQQNSQPSPPFQIAVNFFFLGGEKMKLESAALQFGFCPKGRVKRKAY